MKYTVSYPNGAEFNVTADNLNLDNGYAKFTADPSDNVGKRVVAIFPLDNVTYAGETDQVEQINKKPSRTHVA